MQDIKKVLELMGESFDEKTVSEYMKEYNLDETEARKGLAEERLYAVRYYLKDKIYKKGEMPCE